jgi:phage terminase Nu1 subunit (DNA packaging protein)
MSKCPRLFVPAATAARVLDLSRRQFDRLVKAGILPAKEAAGFDLATVVPAFVRYIGQGREGLKSLADARLASEVARAQLLRARVALMNHELVRTDVAAEVFSSMAGLMVSAVSALQSRVQSAHPEIAALIRDEVYAARTEIANGAERLADQLARGERP